MKQLVVINLTTKTTDWQPPVLTFGESLTLGLRFQKDVAGQTVEPNLIINSARASIGVIDARPGGGTFALQFDSDEAKTTADIPHNASTEQLAAAINAVAAITGAHGTVVVKKVNESWLLRFGTGAAEVAFQVVNNTLWPISFGRVGARQIDSKWVHDLRLVQGPVAFTTATDGDVTPPPLPSITVWQHGGASGSILYDTIQQLYIPADFRGAYRIKKGFQRTELIAPDAGADEIQAALINAFGAGFTVTLPLSYHFLIDLGGAFAGLDVPAMTVEGAESPVGDLIMTIPLDRAELSALLRGVTSATLPLEIRLNVSEDGGDPQEIVALMVAVTIRRPLSFPELEDVPAIDWLRYPSPKTYIPFGAGNSLTTGQTYAALVGNGSTTSFDLTHGLASEDVGVFVRQNGDPGNQLVLGTDYSITITGPNALTVTALGSAPALHAWRVIVFSAQTIAQWAADLTVTIEQVIGLEDALGDFDTRITHLEALIPSGVSTPSGTAPISDYKIELPPASEILFARDTTGVPITDAAKLPARGAFLLPAIHKLAPDEALPEPLPVATLNNLYTTTEATLIPGGGHIRSSYSTAGGYVGSDGRINYPVTRSGTKNSYFPTPFERTLFEVMINDKMFSSGTQLTLLFKLALQLINADSEAQWMLAIEAGAITTEVSSDPNTYDANLYQVNWNTAAPIVQQRLLISSALETHGFGCYITNSAGVFAGSGACYKQLTPAPDGSLPADHSAQFALRARLFNFDTRNNAANARGWLSWSLQAPDNGGTLGVVIA